MVEDRKVYFRLEFINVTELTPERLQEAANWLRAQAAAIVKVTDKVYPIGAAELSFPKPPTLQ